ncbi:FYVE zinc finger-domain-containing protein [Roridomyces roridus]|uniref:FYVE zinc finger-domain-containing protein n=1 Tax=Roridomyces roridus TaxID=1738132 RepID=A0AAD7BTH8_9AGAR|nr:FYVE zinc finger-domain-containing protein [Roridomyces roridus]
MSALSTALKMHPCAPFQQAPSSSPLDDSCSSLSDSRSIASTSSAPILRIRVDSSVRPNEHLAVLLPKQLWKADSSAVYCDNFHCRMPFSIWERRHHCRKCGGIFCHLCSARTTPLLDASKLTFIHPPRNTPLRDFETPSSPIIDSRVCDDCWDQIHACHTPELPLRRPVRRSTSLLSSPISMFKSPLWCLCPLSPIIPSNLSRTRPNSPRTSLRNVCVGLIEEERSYGELDAYPLRRSSLRCKAAGGGRWEPKMEEPDPARREPLIGGKAPFELELEAEEEEQRRRKCNPIICDGDFQYRFPSQEDEPVIEERRPLRLSTF